MQLNCLKACLLRVRHMSASPIPTDTRHGRSRSPRRHRKAQGGAIEPPAAADYVLENDAPRSRSPRRPLPDNDESQADGQSPSHEPNHEHEETHQEHEAEDSNLIEEHASNLEETHQEAPEMQESNQTPMSRELLAWTTIMQRRRLEQPNDAAFIIDMETRVRMWHIWQHEWIHRELTEKQKKWPKSQQLTLFCSWADREMGGKEFIFALWRTGRPHWAPPHLPVLDVGRRGVGPYPPVIILY